MAAYYHIKALPKSPVGVKSIALSSAFISSGMVLLTLAVWPILSFQFLTTSKLNSTIISPIASQQVLGAKSDLTSVSNWFPTAVQSPTQSKITSYTISIPKLGIKDAAVIIGGENLDKGLIQWGGTAMPGEYGTTVIFGHSVLPAFYNPKSYTTIFSTLDTLKIGDDIFVYFDGITYRFVVNQMKVVKPEDTSVLEQGFDDAYLTLITCVPPGTEWERLAVKAKLAKI